LRREEPTDFDQALMNGYLEEIRAWEREPWKRPQAFSGDEEAL